MQAKGERKRLRDSERQRRIEDARKFLRMAVLVNDVERLTQEARERALSMTDSWKPGDKL